MAEQRGFNIDNFRAYNNLYGNLRNNKFIMEIPMIPALTNVLSSNTKIGAKNIARYLELACDTVNFPSTGVDLYSLKRYGYGPIERKPVSPTFPNVQATFLSDDSAYIMTYFQEWMKIIANYDHSQPTSSNTGNIGGTGVAPFELGFKDDYACDIKLRVYSVEGKQVKAINMRQAFPVQIGDISLSWSNQNEIAKIPVAFTFHDWSDVTNS